MAAICVASPAESTKRDVFRRQKTPRRSQIQLGEYSSSRSCAAEAAIYPRPADRPYRCSAHTALHESSNKHTLLLPRRPCITSCQKSYNCFDQGQRKAHILVAALLRDIAALTGSPYRPCSPKAQATSPQSYDEAEPLAVAALELPFDVPRPQGLTKIPQRQSLPFSNMDFKLDFEDTTGIQSRGKKAARKKAQQANFWASDNEGDGNANGDGGDNSFGGAGDGNNDGAAGGGGDDNGGGDGGDDGDDWAFGSSKKNKKKNKKKQEEEEKKRLEEEEEKKKEDAAAATSHTLSWADETNDANQDDEWTAGFVSKKDKKKKKKGGEDVFSAVPNAPANAAFQDISLDDTAPKLEFSFGGNDSKKDSGSFGAWGNTWDFGSIGKATADKLEEKSKKGQKDTDTGFGDNNPWSFSTKSKKKTGASDFDFGDFGTSKANDFGFDGDFGDTKTTDDAWGFSTLNKKDKKKGGFEEKKEEDKFGLDGKEEDTWGGWGTSSTKKGKKGKKGALEEEPIPPPPPPAPEPAIEDDFGFSFGKKDKKKSKKGAFEETSPETKADPVLDIGEADTGFDWVSGTKKDKKKKNLVSEVLDLEPPKDPEPAAKEEDEDDWMKGAWGKKSTKKDKKASTKDTTISATADALSESKKSVKDDLADDVWATFGSAKSKKDDKKAKKGPLVEEEPPPPPPPDPVEDEIWGAFGKKAKDKKGKKGKDASPEPAIAETTPEVDISLGDTAGDDSWGFGLSAKEKKKKEKEAKKKGQAAVDEIPAATSDPTAQAQEDLLAGFGTTTTDKKKKDSAATKKKKSVFDSLYPDPEPEPEKKEDPMDDLFGGGWGLSAKDKKKKEKEDKKKEEDAKKAEEAAAKEVEKAKVAEDDIWGSFGSKSTKKVGKKSKFEEPPPPAPTPPAQGLTPEPEALDLEDDFGDDTWAGLTTSKSKTSTKKGTLSKTTTKDSAKSKEKDVATEKSKGATEETPAKAVKSMWAFGSTSTSKPLTKKEKEAKAKRDAEEQAQKEEEERLAREAEEQAAAEAAKLEEEKNAKKSKSGRLSKTVSKASDKSEEKKKKAEEDIFADLLSEPTPKSTKSSKITKTTSKIEDKDEAKPADDYFGFWGTGTSNKKTAGKKDADAKKEIKSKGPANEKDALADLTNDLDFGFGDSKAASSSKVTKAMSADKTLKGTSSVKDRIKQLETAKEEAGKKSKTDAALTKKSPTPDATLSPKEEKKEKEKASTATSKLKSSTVKDAKSSSKKKDSSSPVEQKKSKDSVPGSFPGAFGDEDMIGLGASSPEKSKAKSTKVDPKTSKTKSSAKKSAEDDLKVRAPDPPKLPTPPPEDKKSSKKERPRVERSSTSSWGFWGAAPTPKKSSKETVKDDENASPPSKEKKAKSPPGLTRSKSTRTPKEKEKEDLKEAEKQSKSSESEKDVKVKRAERPAKPSRGTSFSNFMFGGPPPSAMRSKPTRRSSVTGASRTSSRQSSDGLPSPPPDDDVEMNDKAAKLMGVKSGRVERKSSIKSKSKVPDPYPIDDDDMVMINAPETPVKERSKDKSTTKSSKAKAEVGSEASSKRQSTMTRPSWLPDFIKEVQADGKVSYKQVKSHKKDVSHDDDVVMVDSTLNGDPLVTSGPDDMAFVDHPPSAKRSNTAKRTSGFFGSFFGGGVKAAEPLARPRSTTLTDAEDATLPIRTKSARKKSRAADVDEFITDAPAETDADARRAERRSKRADRDRAEEAERAERETRRKERREREKADVDARRSKARDKERNEREAQEERREEKRARRPARESARYGDDDLGPTTEADKRKEERRRLREKLEAQGDFDLRSSKEDRKKRYEEEEEERRRRKEREARSSKDKDRSSRHRDKDRKRSSALVEEYHASRSGSRKGHLEHVPESGKTSSWVNSQADEPPDVPPLAETVLDPAGERPRAPDEGSKGSGGRSSKKDKYAGMTDREIEDARRERRRSRRVAAEKTSASGGSDERRRSKRYVNGGDDYPIITFDGRPDLKRTESKRKSFLGGFF